MATPLSSISSPPAQYPVDRFKACMHPSSYRARNLFFRSAGGSLQAQLQLSTKPRLCSASGAAVEDGRLSEELSISIDVLHRFIELNLGKWIGSFHQFDFKGNLLQKISTRLAVSSYGEDELRSLIQSLYIKQPPLSASGSDDESEWFEYKIKETNMFTVDKYQQLKLVCRLAFSQKKRHLL